ncbi:SusC/RagA family TonB-linked outer membrane protein [Echinicola shivajiensis]|uniref:SusC/RagA family TonB-linked outer membrane protein n=1 Tax=Echinicola shivajiensis TaxID=1035916 RepID=UPI001BFC4761|nr:TonB-dependent receptor [Echinicola shivajiensis]
MKKTLPMAVIFFTVKKLFFLLFLMFILGPPIAFGAIRSEEFFSDYDETNKGRYRWGIKVPIEHLVKGKVLEKETGETLPGVAIMLKGTSIGTITDLDGNYSLTIPDGHENPVIVFRSLGYLPIEIAVDGKSQIDVELVSSMENLDEVVVVGYGVQEKESSLASISQVTGEDLQKNGAVSLSNALTGRAPGVFTVQTSGEPGADAARLLIRGKSSWVDNSPLVLVDGVERNYNDIDPNEVETISVLKDASATAVFGVKGANGVILITTKRGREGAIKLNYTSELSLKEPLLRRNMAGSYETALVMNEAYRNDGSWNSLIPESILEHYRLQDMPYIYPNTDWEEMTIRDYGYAQKHNLNFSGGTKFAKIFTSLSYLYDGDIYKTVKNPLYDPEFKYNRYNYRTNIDMDITSTTKLSLDAGGYVGVKNSPNETAGIRINRPIFMLGPMEIPPFYPSEVLEQYPDSVFPDETGLRYSTTGIMNANNPYNALNNSGFRQIKTTELNTTLKLRQKLDFITEGLVVQGRLAYNHVEGYQKNYNVDEVAYKLLPDGTWERYKGRDNEDNHGPKLPISPGDEFINRGPFRSTYYEASINYARKFNRHDITALFLGNRRTWQNDVDFPHYEEGIVGRVTYNYNKKYLVEVNMGLNGSEQFAPKHRYGFFPSYAVGWNLHNEDFVKSLFPFLTKAKARYSYGEVGYDGSGGQRWLYTSTYVNGGTNPEHYMPGTKSNSGYNITPILEGQVANINASWERAIKQDLGFELGFLENSMLGLSVDFYQEKRDQILLNRLSLPSWFGVDAKQQNLGATETRGYEVELNYTNHINNELWYWFKAAYSRTDNRIVERDEPKLKPEYQKMAGKRIDERFGYTSVGYIQDVDDRMAAPRYGNGVFGLGDVMYVDFNGDGNIDQMDMVPMAFPGNYPLNTYNFGGGMSYKGFDLDFNFQGATEMSRNFVDAYLWPLHRLGNQIFDYQFDYWTPDNRDSRYPALHMDANRTHNNIKDGDNTTTSVRDASYLRLKSAQIGYVLPERLLNPLKIDKLRFFLRGTNLLSWSPDLPMGDPEGSDGGNGNITFGYYPIIRRFTLGLELSF